MTRRTRGLGFDFGEPKRSGRDVLVLEDEQVEIAGRRLLDHVTFALERGDHVALVGPNGSGKTTLLKHVVAGDFKLGHGVEVGYFSQHGLELDDRGSVLDCVQRMTGLNRPQAQTLLGRFLFSGWDTHMKQVRDLSGGERRRLGLAVLVTSGANLLVLDEPTNHLDLDSRETLEAALEGFPGHRPPRLPRPGGARRSRAANGGDRGRHGQGLRRRLGRSRARARGARGAGHGRAAAQGAQGQARNRAETGPGPARRRRGGDRAGRGAR